MAGNSPTQRAGADIDWRDMFRFTHAIRLMDNAPTLTIEKAYESTDKMIALMERQAEQDANEIEEAGRGR